MPSIEVEVNVKVDGNSLAGYPVVRRLEVNEIAAFDYQQVNQGDTTTFIGVPADILDTIRAIILRVDQPMNLRLNGQSDAGIDLSAGALLVILDALIDAGAGASNASLNNNSGNIAVIRGLAGGESA